MNRLSPARMCDGRFRRRRGVASVLAMMFLVIFGSLAVAMAVVAQGNLRTADSSLKVSRAMSAAETGMVFASRRLASEGKRFVVDKGVIDADFAEDLWVGTYSEATDGAVDVLPPEGYPAPADDPDGLIHAVRDAHLADSHAFNAEVGDALLPTVDENNGVLLVRPIMLTDDAGDGPYFRLRYELLEDESGVRVTCTGVDREITRTLQMDFIIDKKIEYAVISPSRIMIGKNVLVEGPLGSRYGIEPGELDTDHGDPLVMRSDFYYLDDDLNDQLDTLYDKIKEFDVDGDARLRPEHPTEGSGLAASPSMSGADYDNDEYVDDFDLFLNFYDSDDDGKVCYDQTMANNAGLGLLPEEFAGIDDQLAHLIDSANPDRDNDGEITASDTSLGYQDGVVDDIDLYAKVRGELAFAVAKEPWEDANGDSYQSEVQGPVRPKLDDPPVEFEVSDEELRELTTEMFDSSQDWFDDQAQGDFSAQVASNLAGDGTYTEADDAPYEEMPLGSGQPNDFYQRPIYEDMTFTNVRIPLGNNGLFKNCTFIGVTFIDTYTDCTDPDWNYAGSVHDPDDDGVYTPKFPEELNVEIDGNTVYDTKPYSNNIRFESSTFLGSISGIRPGEYTHWRNKLQFTGETRFYIDEDDPDLLDQPDADELLNALDSLDDDDIEEMKKSSVMMPGWSVDAGSFTNEGPSLKLKGTLISGIFDIRGKAVVEGTLMMTFRPIEGVGPLFHGGQLDVFNTTIGYFGPIDGDEEGIAPGDPAFNGFGEITLRYDPDAKLPDGIPWPITVSADPSTYVEGGL